MLHIAPNPPLAALRRLLRDENLPVSDLANSPALKLYACGDGNRLSGVVGLEHYGETALLRSLAVAAAARRQGVGAALLAYAETRARAGGARDIYLLTTTAEAFFARRGYARSERSSAPQAIRDTREFTSLCPGNAVLMRKALTGD